MAEEKIINLDKIRATIEKIEANPDLLNGLNAELDKLWDKLRIDLNSAERQYLLIQLASTPGKARFFGICFAYCPAAERLPGEV